MVAAEPCSSIHRVFHPGGDASVRDPPWAPRPVKSKVRLELPAHWGVHPTPPRRMAGIRQARQPCLDAGSSCRRPSREKSIKGDPRKQGSSPHSASRRLWGAAGSSMALRANLILLSTVFCVEDTTYKPPSSHSSAEMQGRGVVLPPKRWPRWKEMLLTVESWRLWT